MEDYHTTVNNHPLILLSATQTKKANGAAAASQKEITLENTTDKLGMHVTGTNIAASTVVDSISDNKVTLNKNIETGGVADQAELNFLSTL